VCRIYVHDITERRRAEEIIVRVKEEWERTFDSVLDLIAILDNQHRVIRVNQAMAITTRLGVLQNVLYGKIARKSIRTILE
jgi:PAS domain-containing protein